MPFDFIRNEISGLVVIQPRSFRDNRGFFLETYKQSDFEKEGITEEFVQFNHSYSLKGTLRGLHFQKSPFGQGKLVRCTRGRVWDVAVDLRPNSQTFSQHYGLVLSEENQTLFFIPNGFAHGFYVLSEEAEFLYSCTSEYNSQAESGVVWNDPDLDIPWPIGRV
jgi:dTDP-4-dehydrorhamnose 3,5-epimerase